MSGSELTQYAVHHPVGRGGAYTVTGAYRLSVKMVNYSLNQRELYVFGIGYVKLMTTVTVMQGNGLECEYGEADHAFVPNKLYAVFLCGLIGYKTPGT